MGGSSCVVEEGVCNMCRRAPTQDFKFATVVQQLYASMHGHDPIPTQPVAIEPRYQFEVLSLMSRTRIPVTTRETGSHNLICVAFRSGIFRTLTLTLTIHVAPA